MKRTADPSMAGSSLGLGPYLSTGCMIPKLCRRLPQSEPCNLLPHTLDAGLLRGESISNLQTDSQVSSQQDETMEDSEEEVNMEDLVLDNETIQILSEDECVMSPRKVLPPPGDEPIFAAEAKPEANVPPGIGEPPAEEVVEATLEAYGIDLWAAPEQPSSIVDPKRMRSL